MLIGAYLAFILATAASITGWGVMAVPRSREWPEVFGAGTLVTFFMVAAAGWSGLLRPGVLWVLLAGGLVLWASPGHFRTPRGMVAITLAGLAVFPLVLMPPASRDALIHHLYQARLWLEAGRIVRPDWSGFFSYPYLTEALYTLAGGTFGFRVSRALSFLAFLACCSVPAAYFLRAGRKREAVLSLLVLLSVPELFRNASWSYSDTFLVFFSLLAYVELIRKEGNPVLAAVWAAGAACCKYNGFLVLASVCILIPFHFRRMSPRAILAASLAVLFVTAWWAVPNILQWGNPVYPLMRGVFGPAETLSERAAGYFAAAPFGTSLRGVTDYLLLPVRMSLHGRWDDPFLFDGATGPLVLAGIIVSLPVLKDRRRKLVLPLLYVVLSLVSRGAGIRSRYLLPGIAMLSIPAAEGLAALLQHRGRIVRLGTAVLAGMCLVWSGTRVAELYTIERPWEMGSDREYLARKLPCHEFFRECDRYIAAGDTTLLVNMIRPFYYPGYAVFDQQRAPLGLLEMFWGGMSGDEVADSLLRMGISHVAADMFLTSINLTPELTCDETDAWREFVSLRLVPLFTLDRYVLFEILEIEPGHPFK